MQKLAKEKNCAILLVTHDNRILDVAVREAWAMPSRIVQMEDGQLVSHT
jgi:putative ABC transport system ATP-binding protein